MEHKKKDIILPLSLFILTILTRIPFTSKYLYNWDSVQFALALEHYDITVHQPHPPGYFLYVMLGRLINLFIRDANDTFILISILFSGLTVATIYYLGKEIFDKKIGIFAALIALTSPNLWFHGEVALTYVVEAFFSSFVALLCWRIIKGQHKYLWLSVIALAIAGGIRQNTIVFLVPLWLFSVKGIACRKIIASIGLLGVVCLLWFVPMVWMTGGWNAYNESLRELWEFYTGRFSVFEKGWRMFKIFSLILLRYALYGIGTGIFILGLSTYSLIRQKKLGALDKQKTLFILMWITPSILFYLLIFIHPANPGYVLVFLPSLLLLTAAAIGYLSDNIKIVFKKDLGKSILSLILIVNTIIFVFAKYPYTYQNIKEYDSNLPMLLNSIKSFDPLTTGVFATEYLYYSYRHIMYYLPEYYVYDAGFSGERKLFWGTNRTTHLSDDFILPKNIRKFVVPLVNDEINKFKLTKEMSIYNIENTKFCLITGDIKLLNTLLPKMRHQLQQEDICN
jgi:hypothetical protein